MLLLAACSAPPAVLVRPPAAAPSAKAAAPDPAAQSCYNMQYSFTCVPPSGFVITSEETGPGQVMTLVKRSNTSAEQPNIAVRVYPLKGATLARFFERRVLGALESAEGVSELDSKPAAIEGREGFSAALRRSYASGDVYMRVFCFQYGNDAYLIEYSDPAAGAPRDARALEAFVRSFAFR